MKTKLRILGTIIAMLIVFAFSNDGHAQICATCPGNTVTGIKASAFGDGNTASGNYSFVAGRNSIANQSNAVVIGSDSRASGGHSYAIGSTTFALGNFSYAFGGNSTSESDFSMVLGHNLLSRNGGFVLGSGRVDAKLTNNLQGSLMIGFNSAYPTLFVSRTVYGQQSGRVGIGNVTNQQAKLHIKADDNGMEEAGLMLESSGNTRYARQQIQFADFKFGGVLAEIVNENEKKFNTLSFKVNSDYESKMLFHAQRFIFEKGSVGIGTEEPQAMLDVAGEAMVDGLIIRGGYSLPIYPGNQTQFLRGDGVWAVPAGGGGGGSSYWLPSGNNIYYTGGNVGIGTASTDYKLTVAGGIHAREVKVTLNAGADYVFASDYKLTPLHELENFVIANKHLPGIASETEMLEQGLDMGSFQIKLLEKIEELTLYIIQQQKEIDALKASVSKP